MRRLFIRAWVRIADKVRSAFKGQAPAPPDFGIKEVKAAELRLILGKHSSIDPSEVSPWGLALSGGGIRSATFSLGVLQALARLNLLPCFHYQSTVSGGGYIGGFLQALIVRRGVDNAFNVLKKRLADGNRSQIDEVRLQGLTQAQIELKQQEIAQKKLAAQRLSDDLLEPIRHLRRYSNYLSPRKSPISGDTMGMISTYLRNVLLIQVQLCALLLALSLVPYLIYWGMLQVKLHPLHFSIVALLLCALVAVLLSRIAASLHQYYPQPKAEPKPDVAADARFEPKDGGELETKGSASSKGDKKELARPNMHSASRSVLVMLLLASLISANCLPYLQESAKIIAMPKGFASITSMKWLDVQIGSIVAFVYWLIWLPWYVFEALLSRQAIESAHPNWSSAFFTHWRRFQIAAAIAAVLAGLLTVALRNLLGYWANQGGALWGVTIFGPSLILIALMVVGSIHVGLAGPALNELQREVWARLGGKATTIIMIGLGLSMGLAIYGPWLLTAAVHTAGKRWLELSGWLGVTVWLLTSGVGLFAAYSQRGAKSKDRSAALEIFARAAPWVFVLGLLVAISLAGQALLDSLIWSKTSYVYGDSLAMYLSHLADGAEKSPAIVASVVLLAILIWVVFSSMININDFSLNAFYSNRLVRCYLGASNRRRDAEPITEFDPRDDLWLADVVGKERPGGGRPLYPLIGANLNLVGARQLDWQDRKGASFCLSPGYCGYLPPPSRPNAKPIGDKKIHVGALARGNESEGAERGGERRAESLSTGLHLGSAIAISGAAVSPNMGYHSSPAVTFLLTLFDARLGWWLPNPCHARGPAPTRTPFSGSWLLAELFGMTHDGGEFVHLSDGGHFENLAIYELVRRSCRFIVCVDASADPNYEFEDLGNAVQKCRLDFGVDISINVDALRPDADGRAASSCAVGQIRYPDRSVGTLLYLKPALTGEEPTDIQHYHRTHRNFPNEPTSDQYFDEAQFESYRRLGEHAASRALEQALERAEAHGSKASHKAADLRDSYVKERILVELERVWTSRLPAHRERSEAHRNAMSQLFTKLRERPALAVLDAQMYPAWVNLVKDEAGGEGVDAPTPHSRRTRMPSDRDFRECFYFCQQLMQLMEMVYHDLEMEHTWQHPDNRGWMNAFKQWSWTPMFRIAWIAGVPCCGARFVTFCEMRLDMPRLNRVLRATEIKRRDGDDWNAYCDDLVAKGEINHVERQILASTALNVGAASEWPRVFLLQLKWDAVQVRTSHEISNTTLGLAVVVGGSLRLLRVQDHLRGLGLGAEFIRRLLSQVKIEHVEIRPGHYGVVGACGKRRAKYYQGRLEEWLQMARKHLRSRDD